MNLPYKKSTRGPLTAFPYSDRENYKINQNIFTLAWKFRKSATNALTLKTLISNSSKGKARIYKF